MKVTKKVEKFLEQVADRTDTSYSISENGENCYCVEFEYWSDLGEDCLITLVINGNPNIEDITHAMYEYEEDFDAEEHATEWFNMHGKHNAPTSLRALLKDADEQQEKLEEMYEVMRELAY